VGDETPISLDLEAVRLEERRGGLALRAGVVIGLVGEVDGIPSLIPLSRIPEALRPVR